MAKKKGPALEAPADAWLMDRADRETVGVALKLLADALKKATDALAAVGCESINVTRRLAHVEALVGRHYDDEMLGVDQVPYALTWCSTLRVGLSLHHDAIVRVKKAKEKLELETEEEEVRDRQLERLFASLDMAMLRLVPEAFDRATEEALQASADRLRDTLPAGTSAEITMEGRSLLKLEGRGDGD